jgi:MFS family permease
MSASTAAAIVLAFASTTLTNIAYLWEHDAAAELPVLSMRRPLHSVRLLLHDRSWLLGFATESVGFALYAVALALASLVIVQSVVAGGIGVLAFVSARIDRRPLSRREQLGTAVSVLGLAALGVSLAGGSAGDNGSTAGILLWFAVTAGAAVLLLVFARAVGGVAIADGLAGGLFFSIGDISTKVLTQGGARILFAFGLVGGYTLGTGLLQIGYQSGGALTVAGLATLVTNALPIAAGTTLFGEGLGSLPVVRALAFGCTVAGAALLARPAEAERPRALSPAARPIPFD